MPSTITLGVVDNYYAALAASRPELLELLVVWNQNASRDDNDQVSTLMGQITKLTQAGIFGERDATTSYRHLAHAMLICVTAWSDPQL